MAMTRPGFESPRRLWELRLAPHEEPADRARRRSVLLGLGPRTFDSLRFGPAAGHDEFARRVGAHESEEDRCCAVDGERQLLPPSRPDGGSTDSCVTFSLVRALGERKRKLLRPSNGGTQ
jgi:hypothetical protein